MAALAANLIVNLVMILIDFFELVILPNTTMGDLIALDETSGIALLKVGVYLIELAVFILTAVLFLFWIYRVYKNLRPLGADRLGYSPGWAVGSFFIPFANLFIPFRIIREIWVNSDPLVREPVETWQRSGPPALLSWWWGFWVAANILTRIASRFSDSAETPEQLFLYSKLEIMASALTIGAAIFAIMVVRGIDKRQEARSKQQQLLQEPPPPPVFKTQMVQP
jgi:hypothetical protein